jgi:hypothetical protein
MYNMYNASVQSKCNIQTLLEAYCSIVDKRFARPNDLESYVGGNGSCWSGHPCQS